MELLLTFVFSPYSPLKKPLINRQLQRKMVSPWGVEPQSSEPESDILSIELRRLKKGISSDFGHKIKQVLVDLQNNREIGRIVEPSKWMSR